MTNLNLAGTDLTKASPPEIDADLFLLLQEEYRCRDALTSTMEALHQQLDTKPPVTWQNRYPSWNLSDAELLDQARTQTLTPRAAKLLAAYDATQEKLAEVAVSRLPFDDEFHRRGGWARAYLVDNADGHLHKSMGCSTCNNGFFMTRFYWITEVSGQDEAQIVEAAGEKACTTCYPSAPVDVLKRSSKFEGPDMKAKREAREQRAIEKAQRDRAKAEKAITNPDGTPLRAASYHGTIKTVAAAWQRAVDNYFNYKAYGYGFSNADDANIVAALAFKLGITEDEVREQIEAKLVAKAKREKVAL
jgi:hypothetical protein